MPIVTMARSKSIKRSGKHGKRIFAHGFHMISIPGILGGFGIVSFPLSSITDYGMIFGPMGFVAAVIEVAGKKYKWF
ncbi:hypothetical protein [Nitrosopumilus sp.]|uniref:hypothetical protein n=1 Tax=Nitrosopumilus sp. TaxID=2024843 RepID=UPI00247DD275|nr:hypothetical protein [Nitrosopumilus sp.]MCV0410763.1 hypothetical protein [Nitrosopumilus sp.]